MKINLASILFQVSHKLLLCFLMQPKTINSLEVIICKINGITLVKYGLLFTNWKAVISSRQEKLSSVVMK